MSLVGPDGITPIAAPKPSQGKLDFVSPFRVSSIFGSRNGLGMVKMQAQDGGPTYILSPSEAKILGFELLTQGEASIAMAVALRMLTEPSMGGLMIEQAVATFRAMDAGTRDAHNNAEQVRIAELLEKAKRQGANDAPAADATGEP